MRRSRCRLAAVALLFTFAANAHAQRGVIRGHIRDEAGKPLAYANVMLRWTTIGAMTDKSGRYSMNAPVGEHEVVAMMMGRLFQSRNVRVANIDTVVVDFALLPDPNPQRVVEIPYARRESASNYPSSDDIWPYDAITEPVRFESLELSLRYVLTQQDDSVVVNVVAEGRNVTADPVTVCGYFSFFDPIFIGAPDSHAWTTNEAPASGIPYIKVRGDFIKLSTFECRSERLDPGEVIAHGMSFAFDPEEFKYWTAELAVDCYYFSGRDGVPWNDIKRVRLERLLVPIRPLGQPLRNR